jgi:hypothetical protein
VRLGIPLALVAGLASVSATAAAETRRIAIVVGNNLGNPGRPTLQYAEADAVKVASVLRELGGFDPPDVHVLSGQRTEALVALIYDIGRKLVSWRKGAADRVVLLFYYSGHSDGESLEMDGDRLAFGDLRRKLTEAGADLRLLIVDSCRSGAFTNAKSGVAGPGFDIRLFDNLLTSGEATLAASAADELALESRELRGSFFSHYLVSGLRGAADTSGDGKVTLGELYRFAFTQTVASTSATVAGPQHPTYDYRLSGKGELVLTDLQNRHALLRLPGGYERILITDSARTQVVAETVAGSTHALAVPAGRYRLIARRAGKTFLGTVAVAAGDDRTVATNELDNSAPTLTTTAKGAGSPEEYTGIGLAAAKRSSAENITLGVSMGASDAVARQVTIPLALRVWVRRGENTGWYGSVFLSSGGRNGLRENRIQSSLGYGIAWHRGRLLAQASLELGGGAVLQIDGEHKPNWSGFTSLAPVLLGGVQLRAGLAMTVDASLSGLLIRKDDRMATVWLPAGTAGLIWTF